MTDFDPDVGVLVVHRIGTQAEGSEQRHWADAVLRYLDLFLTYETPEDPAVEPTNVQVTCTSSATVLPRTES